MSVLRRIAADLRQHHWTGVLGHAYPQRAEVDRRVERLAGVGVSLDPLEPGPVGGAERDIGHAHEVPARGQSLGCGIVAAGARPVLDRVSSLPRQASEIAAR
jgi:hypothetical protein